MDIKKNFFTMRELKHSQPLLVSFPSMKTVKVSLERALSTLIWLKLFQLIARGWIR